MNYTKFRSGTVRLLRPAIVAFAGPFGVFSAARSGETRSGAKFGKQETALFAELGRNPVTLPRAFGFLIALALVSTPSLAHAAGAIAVISEMFVETITVEAGKTKTVLVKQDSGPPGTKLVFAHRYRHTSKAPVANFGMTNPIPAGIDYAGTDDASASVSVDGGKIWGALVALKLRGPNASLRAARFDDVTHVRWALKAPVPVGGSGRLSFRGTVK